MASATPPPPGCMYLRFCGENVGTTVRELGGQAQRKAAEPLHIREIEVRQLDACGRLPENDCQRVSRDAQFLPQRRQHRGIACQLTVALTMSTRDTDPASNASWRA